jgi:hypothetical protein
MVSPGQHEAELHVIKDRHHPNTACRSVCHDREDLSQQGPLLFVRRAIELRPPNRFSRYSTPPLCRVCFSLTKGPRPRPERGSGLRGSEAESVLLSECVGGFRCVGRMMDERQT